MKLYTFLPVLLIPLCSWIFLRDCPGPYSNPESADKRIESKTDSLPDVFVERTNLIDLSLRHEAIANYTIHQLPPTLKEWEKERLKLRDLIISKAGIIIDHSLPLDVKEYGTVRMEGYSIRKVTFQTRPGVYATVNLYVPDGKGPFPAVINMHGHWNEGKMADSIQAVGHTLALNGYVCLNIDAFGSGERTTIHGKYEYHGSNLGASLMNVGESLLGFQVSDNMRAVDLLCSLPYVDCERIGATGASGGGNQTMWLTAVDERIRASVPVVSVGTFESYILRSNCVCELLVDGHTFAETSGILALVAPRALRMCNHLRDSNPTFFPQEMKRSYMNARTVYAMYGKEDRIDYKLFDLVHGYMKEDREAMLGWFDLHLKGIGNGTAVREKPFKTLPFDQLMIYPSGKRSPGVVSIEDYCRKKGSELRGRFLRTTTINQDVKRDELKEVLKSNEKTEITQVHRYSPKDGWDRLALETSCRKLIPFLHRAPVNNSRDYILVCSPGGKKNLDPALLKELIQKGSGLILADLTGTGETSSAEDDRFKGGNLGKFHTLARAELWLGRTMMGEWIKDLRLLVYFSLIDLRASSIMIYAEKETGLAALFFTAIENQKIRELTLRDVPLSYIFDTRAGVDFFSLAVHVPGFLKWGDVSLASALTGSKVNIINPVSMSGRKITGDELREYSTEFEKFRKLCGSSGMTTFSN